MIATGKAPVAAILLPFLLLFLLFNSSLANAQSQNAGKVEGRIVSADGNALPYASVVLQRADGKMLKGSLTDTLGQFSFNAVPPGSYSLKITMIGFLPYESASFSLSAEKTNRELPGNYSEGRCQNTRRSDH